MVIVGCGKSWKASRRREGDLTYMSDVSSQVLLSLFPQHVYLVGISVLSFSHLSLSF